MDIITLGTAIAIAKALPDTAVGQAVAAKEAAEAAAEIALEHGIAIEISDGVVEIIEAGGGL